MLSGEAICHRYGTVPVLDGVGLTLAPGEIAGLCGPSGAGKSTLGRIMAGVQRPDGGRVRLDQRSFAARPGHPSPVQYAPQASELSVDPRWKVARILCNGGRPDAGAAAVLGIRPDWSDRVPAELSGGELARVSLARLLLPGTRFLICDEVTAPLDALSTADLCDALRQLARRGMGILLISHNHALLRRRADRVLSLSGGGLIRL